MKDFDFDELDRAVNSVLATKSTKDTQDAPATDDTPTQVPVATDNAAPVETNNQDQQETEATTSAITVSDEQPEDDAAETITVNNSSTTESPKLETHEEESTPELDSPAPATETEGPSEQPSEESVPTEAESVTELAVDEPTEDEQEKEEKPPVDTAALAAIPVKRGRFMDVMAPSGGSDSAKKAFPTRTGVTITPSADFASTSTEDEKADNDVASSAPAGAATPVVASEVEPEVNANEAEKSEEKAETTVPTEQASTADTTPFIPDVPVEKRPLNDLSGQEESTEPSAPDTAPAESTANEPSATPIDPTLTANVPKEFDKEIMAVESNETVGENDETHPDNQEDDHRTDEATPAIAATTAEPHPMFDTSTLAHPSDVHGHHTSKFSWAIIGGSLFVVGAALGVLYFLYGQG